MARKSYFVPFIEFFDRGLQVGQDDEPYRFDVNHHL